MRGYNTPVWLTSLTFSLELERTGAKIIAVMPAWIAASILVSSAAIEADAAVEADVVAAVLAARC